MNIQEAIKESKKTGKPIKREGWLENEWVKVKGNCFYWEDSGDIALLHPDDIKATDWEIENVKEIKREWYKVENFKKAYPNGVLCMVSDNNSNNEFKWHFALILDYKRDIEQFVDMYCEYFPYAKPIPFNKLPSILTDNQIIDIKKVK